MTWTVDGTGADVSFSLNSDGGWKFQGRGKQYCSPSGGDISIFDTLRPIRELEWAIKGGTLTELDGTVLSSELWKKYQQDTTRSCAAISYFPPDANGPAFLGATILLGTGISPIMYDICKLLLSNRSLKYRIGFDFIGFRVEHASHDTPSVREFTHPDLLTRRPYITSGVSLILPDADQPR